MACRDSDGQRADSHGGLIAQQHGAYPLPGLHTDTLEPLDEYVLGTERIELN